MGLRSGLYGDTFLHTGQTGHLRMLSQDAGSSHWPFYTWKGRQLCPDAVH